MKNIRDLLQGPAHPSEAETLRTVVQRRVAERTVVPDELPGYTARLPGDANDHPRTSDTVSNPIPGTTAIGLSRMLRAGEVPVHLERQVRAYIAQYERFAGEVLYSQRNHQEGEKRVNPNYTVTLADPFRR